MIDRVVVISGLAALVAVTTSPLWLGPRQGLPPLGRPAGEEPCIEPSAAMRRDHPAILARWRDAVVREGRQTLRSSEGRTVRMSLSDGCLGCHTEPAAFCDRCHEWAGVRPGCFACHLRPGDVPR
jgi:hypothetical protein